MCSAGVCYISTVTAPPVPHEIIPEMSADAFKGCYKNGTNGTRDYHYFAGLYLLFRVVLLVGYITQPSAFRWLITVPFPVAISLLFALFRPYKNNYFNIIDCLAFALVGLATFLIMYTYTTHVYYYTQLFYVILLTPFLYFICFLYGPEFTSPLPIIALYKNHAAMLIIFAN